MPNNESLSLKGIKWGSKEFEKVIKKAQEEKEIKNEYKKIHEAIRIIKGG